MGSGRSALEGSGFATSRGVCFPEETRGSLAPLDPRTSLGIATWSAVLLERLGEF
jgi:hypothetical protein